MYNCSDTMAFCPRHHPTICWGIVGKEKEGEGGEEREEGEGGEEEEEGEEEGEGEERKREVCGFKCCSRCLVEHTCGDDPTEYC